MRRPDRACCTAEASTAVAMKVFMILALAAGQVTFHSIKILVLCTVYQRRQDKYLKAKVPVSSKVTTIINEYW